MKTVSEYLYELHKPHIEQLVGVAEARVDLNIEEPAVFDHSRGKVSSFSKPAELRITADFYSDKLWSGIVDRRIGSLELRAWVKVDYPIFPAKLSVTIRAWPGKETQVILDILKDSFK